VNVSAFNPELVRNGRIHLRLGRVVVIAAICAVISITAAAYVLAGPLGARTSPTDGRGLLSLILSLQVVALLIGGGIYCLLSVHREKELNTFDFQRITRLSPLELVVGKLFGAPIQMYFAFLCMMPVAIWAASLGNLSVSTFVMVYVLVVLGSIAYHAFALLLSLVMERGTSAGGIIFFLLVVGLTSIDYSEGSSPLGVHALSPFFAFRLFSPAPNYPAGTVDPASTVDTFFGVQVSHSWVLLLLYGTLAAWFLLAAVRNIKRDPLAYELYSPAQGFAFCLYLNLLLLGFLRWSVPQFHYSKESGPYVTYGPIAPHAAEQLFFAIALLFLALFGLTLLRNRDQARRRIRELGARAAGWWAALWPAPYLLLGAIVAGIAIVFMIQTKLRPHDAWSSGSGLLEAAFVSAWVTRDVLYIQWMNLRRVRRPIMMAVLYLVVFYTCTSAIFVPLGLYAEILAPYASIFLPIQALHITSADWANQRGAWTLGLALLCLQSVVFAWLQRRTLQDLFRRSAAV
jgi:hypothetical protein